VSNDGVAGPSEQKVHSFSSTFPCEIRQHSFASFPTSELFEHNCHFGRANVLPRTTNRIISLKKSSNNPKVRQAFVVVLL
jgi:hypothetical protein